DAARAIDPLGVEEAENVFRRLEDFLRIRVRRIVDHRQHVGIDHLPRLHVDVDVENAHASITSRMQTAESGHAPRNSSEPRSCGCTSSRSMTLKPRLRKYSCAVVVSR